MSAGMNSILCLPAHRYSVNVISMFCYNLFVLFRCA
nr:MAG TPA: hypothetical protein [Caudoviricetes sp.]